MESDQTHTNKHKKAQKLLGAVNAYKHADFYRNRSKKTEGKFPQLPPVTWNEIYNCPLGRRTYTSGPHISRIVHRKNMPAIISRSLGDIAAEPYVPAHGAQRPFVGCTDRNTGIELGFWFYEQNILALLETGDIKLATDLARRYTVDAFVGDMESARRLLPFIVDEIPAPRFICIVDIVCDHEFVKKYFPDVPLYVTGYLPEFGAFGYACPEKLKEGVVTFHPHNHTLHECDGKTLLLTKLTMLPTPLLRYNTELTVQAVSSHCTCNERESFSVKI